jgi:uncharacterized protein DUF4440
MRSHLMAITVLCILASPALAGPEEDLMAVDSAFARLSVEKGFDQAFIAYLAEDGQTFTGPTPLKNKADAVRRFNDPKAPHSDPKVMVDWAPETGSVSADGTLAWTEGHFSRTGPGVSITGRYLTVWVKENGSWKLRADLGNTDPKKP